MSNLQSSNVKVFKKDFGSKNVDKQDTQLEELRIRDPAPVISDPRAIIEAVVETHPFEHSTCSDLGINSVLD